MNKPLLRYAIAWIAFLLTAANTCAATAPFTLLHSLFDPGTGPQIDAYQGCSIALDGNIAVCGVPFDDVGGTDSGQVKVYDATTGVLLHTLSNPRPATVDFFGWSVAVSGTRVVVGACENDTGATNAGSAYVYDLASGTPTTPVLVLTNPSPTPDARFGWAVAISGTWLVVGAARDDRGAADAGSAYVYDLAGTLPAVPIVSLVNPNPTADARFGHAVAVSGTRVVIGAIGDNTGAYATGRAYVYDITNPTPAIPVVTLNDPAPANFDAFGFSVGISGPRVVVGVLYGDVSGLDAGCAYVYDLGTATPAVPIATLSNPTPQWLDEFGVAVAISGTRVVVGAHYDDTGAGDSGSANVYDLTSATPTVPVVTLNNPGSEVGDEFGFAVAISGTRVVIGALYDDTVASNAGIGYAYSLASGTPASPVATLASPSPATGDHFGNSVAISGARVVIGAPGDTTGAYAAGRAYLFDLASHEPRTPMLILTNPSPYPGAGFGNATAISGTLVVVGVTGDSTGAGAAGVAYVYDLASEKPWLPMATLTNPAPAALDWFGSSVAVDGWRVVIGADGDDFGTVDAGSAYVYDLSNATPTIPVLTLHNPKPSPYANFGHSVAVSGTRIVIGADGEDTPATEAGRAYVYNLASATPSVPVLTLAKPFPSGFENFGRAVSISGTRVVVGVYKDDIGAPDAGSAYVFDLASATPALPVATLTNPNPAANNYLGFAVAISGTWVVVGEYRTDMGGTDAGSAQVFDLSGPTPGIPVATLNSPNPAGFDYVGAAVAIDGTTVVVGAPFTDGVTPDRGGAYIFGLRPTLSMAPAASGFATLAWTPTNAPGFVLQYKETLDAATWLQAPSGATNPVTVATTSIARFYRVAQP